MQQTPPSAEGGSLPADGKTPETEPNRENSPQLDQSAPAAAESKLKRPPILRPGYRSTSKAPSRLLAGVAAGLAAHLEIPVWLTRVALVVSCIFSGAGLMIYLALWLLIPSGDPLAAVPPPVAQARLRNTIDPGIASSWHEMSRKRRLLLFAVLLFLAAAFLIALGQGYVQLNSWLIPVSMIALGAGIVWSSIPAGIAGDTDLKGAEIARIIPGVVLVALGIISLLVSGSNVYTIIVGVLGTLAVLLGVGMVLIPVVVRQRRVLQASREAEVREAERADIAAHLHDSVLQTLTLIRQRSEDPAAVAALARTQERELRAWLYTDRPTQSTSVAAALKEAIAEVEDTYATPIEIVVVGDLKPGPAGEALVAIVREAATNAVRHGAPPVSIYAELRSRNLESYVRDHGAGFEIDDIPPDRHGIRDSMLGRAERLGGNVRIRRRPDGTEIEIRLPVEQEAPSPQPSAETPETEQTR